MARPSSYPQLTPGTPFLTYADDGTADRHAEMAGFVSNPPATKAEVRAGSATDKVVTPSTLRSALAVHEAASQRQWSPWGALTVGFFTTYGTPLNTVLSYRDDNGGQYGDDDEWSPTVNPLTTTGTYGDMVGIYNGGFVDTITQPPAPSVGDRWELALMFKARTGSALIMLTRWRDAGLRLYRSSSFDTPVWEDMPASSDEILHNPLAATDGTGWHITYGDPSQWPASSDLNVRYHLNDGLWLTKLEGNTLTAITVGYNASTPYVIAHASRQYEGVSALVGSDPIFLVDSASELPSNPVTDTIILAGATFGTYTAGRLYRYDGSAYVLYPLDLSAMTGEITVANIDSGNAGNNTVPTADGSGGVVWRAQQGGSGGGSTHPYLVSGNTTAPDAWQVNDVVINIASNNVTIARGTDTNNILLPKTWNRIASISTNEISFADLQFRGSLIVGQRTIAVNKFDPGSATDGQVAQVDTVGGTKQVVYDDLPNNSVGFDQINDANKAANRIIHYNAAGTGITSSPHTDFDISATQLTSDTIPAARYGTNIPAGNLTGRIGTANLPTTIPLANLPDDIGSAVHVAADLDTMWHSPGVYRVAPTTKHPHYPGGTGILIADHNNQTVVDSGSRAGEIHNRERAIAVTTQGVFATLTNLSGFTRITDMSTNLNDITEYGYYWWNGPRQSTGDTDNDAGAGNDRPVNSPGYFNDPDGTVEGYHRTAFAELREHWQLVVTGGSYLGNVSNNKVLFRRRAKTGSRLWQTTWTNVTSYSTGPGLSPLDPLIDDGLKYIRNLNQLPDEQSTDYYWYIPIGDMPNHPTGGTSTSPALVRYTYSSLAQTEFIQFVYNYGVVSGSGFVAEPRVKSNQFSQTATAWAVKSDSITGGSYSSANGTVTLTRDYGSNISITGLPYVTSS